MSNVRPASAGLNPDTQAVTVETISKPEKKGFFTRLKQIFTGEAAKEPIVKQHTLSASDIQKMVGTDEKVTNISTQDNSDYNYYPEPYDP